MVLPLAPEPRRRRFNVVIETPKGSRNKFQYIPSVGMFALGKQLPAGAVFPFDFGFIPGTRAEDGDPLDAIVLLDTPTFPGCIVRVRLIGMIDAHQTTKTGGTVRNPRLIAISTKSLEHRNVRRVRDLPETVIHDIEHFFASYNQAVGKIFAPVGRRGRKQARRMVRETLIRGTGRVGRRSSGEVAHHGRTSPTILHRIG